MSEKNNEFEFGFWKGDILICPDKKHLEVKTFYTKHTHVIVFLAIGERFSDRAWAILHKEFLDPGTEYFFEYEDLRNLLKEEQERLGNEFWLDKALVTPRVDGNIGFGDDFFCLGYVIEELNSIPFEEGDIIR